MPSTLTILRNIFLTLFFFSAALHAEDWPSFLGPHGDGISRETGLLKEWPTEGPPVLWKKKVGEGYAAPAVLGQRLVFFHRKDNQEIVECLHPETGATLWTHTYQTNFIDPYGYNGGPRAAPVLTQSHCYTLGAEGVLTCVTLNSGKLNWKRDLTVDFDIPAGFFGIGSTPLVNDNKLFVMVGGHPQAGVVAFDTLTGKTLWEAVCFNDFPEAPVRIQRDRPPEKMASYSSPVLATIQNTQHLLCFMRPGIISLDPINGKKRFAFWFRSKIHDSVNAAQPVVIGNRIFLSAAYDTGAVMLEVLPDNKSTTIVWQDELAMENHWSTSIYRAGHLFGFSGRHEYGSDFRCIDATTGKLIWRVPDQSSSTKEIFYGRGSAIFVDEQFIILGERGTLSCANVHHNHFQEIHRVQIPEFEYPCWTAPILSHGKLFITGCRSVEGSSRQSREEYHLICLNFSTD
ncbi:MAG: PQQ-binding-like beta-propeller repeat protein [Pirellulales bacterium]